MIVRLRGAGQDGRPTTVLVLLIGLILLLGAAVVAVLFGLLLG
jgi:hypothetical protein